MPCVGYMHIGNLVTPFAITINEIKLLPVTFQLSLYHFIWLVWRPRPALLSWWSPWSLSLLLINRHHSDPPQPPSLLVAKLLSLWLSHMMNQALHSSACLRKIRSILILFCELLGMITGCQGRGQWLVLHLLWAHGCPEPKGCMAFSHLKHWRGTQSSLGVRAVDSAAAQQCYTFFSCWKREKNKKGNLQLSSTCFLGSWNDFEI